MEAAPSAFVARLHVPGLNATRLLHRPKVAPEPQSPHLETPLVAAKSSRRIAEPASDMVLTGVPGFEKRSHGVGFRGAILGGVMGKDGKRLCHEPGSLGGCPRSGHKREGSPWCYPTGQAEQAKALVAEKTTSWWLACRTDSRSENSKSGQVLVRSRRLLGYQVLTVLGGYVRSSELRCYAKDCASDIEKSAGVVVSSYAI